MSTWPLERRRLRATTFTFVLVFFFVFVLVLFVCCSPELWSQIRLLAKTDSRESGQVVCFFTNTGSVDPPETADGTFVGDV